MQDRELTYFKMNILQAEIEMNGMIAENKIMANKDNSVKYGYDDFVALIEKYHIYHNAFPFVENE